MHINAITLCDCDKSKRSVYFVNSQLRQDSLYIFIPRMERELGFYIPSHHVSTYTIFSLGRKINKETNQNKENKERLKSVQ